MSSQKLRRIAAELTRMAAKPKVPRIDQFRKIVQEHQAAKIEGVLVDGFTASMVVQVWDKLNEENRAKLDAMPIKKMVPLLWKLVSKKASAKPKRPKRATAVDYDQIVEAFAKAILTSTYASAIEEAQDGADSESEGELTDTPWGAGAELMDYAPPMSQKLISAVETWLGKVKAEDSTLPSGAAGVEQDCLRFKEKSGENEETYGHYLAMQAMGHGVGLHDYDYDTGLKLGYDWEHITGWLSAPSEEKILFHLAVPGNPNIQFDVTSELLDLATDKLLAGGQTIYDTDRDDNAAKSPDDHD